MAYYCAESVKEATMMIPIYIGSNNCSFASREGGRRYAPHLRAVIDYSTHAKRGVAEEQQAWKGCLP